MSKGYVLSLCDRMGQMVLPWMEAGYRAIRGDIRSVTPMGFARAVFYANTEK